MLQIRSSFQIYWDFSNLIKDLDLIDVAFISIKMNFDLNRPMRRAMMIVTSVFTQLERVLII